MKLIELRVSNFTSWETATLAYPTRGLILVSGQNMDQAGANSNMAGKTNLLTDALTWVLWGELTKAMTPSGTRIAAAKADDAIRAGFPEARVEVDFERAGHQWTVVRTRRRGQSTRIQLVCDGGEVEAVSNADLQTTIDLLVGDYTTFSQTVLFGQGARRFTQMTDRDRKQILEQMLGLEVLSRGLTRARSESAEAEKNLTKAASGQVLTQERLDLKREHLQQLKEQYKTQQAMVAKWEADRQVRVERAEASCEDATRRELQIRQKLEESQRKLLEATRRAEALAGIEERTEKARERFLSAVRDIKAREEEIQRQTEAIKRLKKLQGTCPTCEQDISTDHCDRAVEEHNAEVVRLSEARSSAIQARDTAQEQFQVLDKSRQKLAKLLQVIASEQRAVQDGEQAQEEALEAIRDQVEHLRSVQDETPPPSPDTTRLKTLEKELKELSRQIKETSADIVALQRRCLDVDFWVHAFGNAGIKSRCLDSVVDRLTNLTNEYLSYLAGGLSVEFDTQSYTAKGEARERFEIRVYTGGDEGYRLASGGERRRVDFCVSLALQSLERVAREGYGFYLFDEPFEGVDETGVEEIVGLLRRFVDQRGVACFVITHSRHMESLFDRHIQVIKKDGVSRLG